VTLQDVWDRQSFWSQTADRLKKKVQNRRNVGLGFSLAGAILATAAVVAGLDATTGKVLAALGAFAVAVAGLTRPFGATTRFRTARARGRCPRGSRPRSSSMSPRPTTAAAPGARAP
jgi:hypothetical protein